MNLKVKQIALTTFFLLVCLVGVVAQKPANDSLYTKLILDLFENDLSRKKQLDVLDKAQGEEFDLAYELKLILQNMTTKEKEALMKYTYRKAGKPMSATKPVAKIYWKEVEYNFGVVKRGRVVKHTFNFTNIGKIPYEIQEIEGSCGCTVASYTKGVIPPGGKGKVVVTYDSGGKDGENTELVTIVGNSHPERVVLLINVHVRK